MSMRYNLLCRSPEGTPMKGILSEPFPLEPLLHAYVQAGVPCADALGPRAKAVLGARSTFLSAEFLDRAPDSSFQTEILRFYEACVSPPLHANRVLRKARVIRHAVTHLCHCSEPLPSRLARCVNAN